ncbi:MAG: hypothetical protein AAF652_20750, partial [Cyanobacteria bacterium P01_C01_bin.72]
MQQRHYSLLISLRGRSLKKERSPFSFSRIVAKMRSPSGKNSGYLHLRKILNQPQVDVRKY